MSDRPIKVYTASQTKHAELWRSIRRQYQEDAEPPGLIEFTATWIDEAGPGETQSLERLWIGCIAQAAAADWVIAFHEPGDVWKGAYVEVGAALAHSVPVLVVGDPPGSWVEHPAVVLVPTIAAALHHVRLAGHTREFGPPSADEILRVKRWECSQAGHQFSLILKVGQEAPAGAACDHCGATFMHDGGAE